MEGIVRNFEADPGASDQHAGEAEDGGVSERVSPLRAIRRHCVDCCNGSLNEVGLCISRSCPLWPFRFGTRLDAETVAALAGVEAHPAEIPLPAADIAAGSRLKAIRRRCIDCSGGNQAEVRRCPNTSCDLHQFRMGKGTRSANLTDEQRAEMAARLRRWLG